MIKKIFSLWFLLMCCSQLVIAQSNGKIISKEKIFYPVYNKVQGIDMYYDSATYTLAVQDKSVQTEKIFYKSDGLKVVAYLSLPANLQKKKYPVIIFNRGSLIRNDIAIVHRPLFQKLVKAGFVVIAPALRQSEGSEGKDEIGGKDVNDILNLLPLLSSLPYTDTANIFMWGESRGGIMTFLVLKQGFHVRAAATIGAITDMELFAKETPGIDEVTKQFIPGFENNKEQLLKDRSVVNWAEKINVPVLIMNGGADPQVKPYHALNLAAKLQEYGKTYQLMILEGGNHILSGKHTNERDRQVTEWFKKYLK